MHRIRTMALLVVAPLLLAPLLLGSNAAGSNYAPGSLDRYFRLEWKVVPGSRGPMVEGYVYNLAGMPAERMSAGDRSARRLRQCGRQDEHPGPRRRAGGQPRVVPGEGAGGRELPARGLSPSTGSASAAACNLRLPDALSAYHGPAMRPTRGLYLAGVLVLLVLVPAPAGAQSHAGPAYVTRVVDGVTLYADVDGRIETVRYLGVRVPRIDDPNYGNSPYAVAAREANRRLVEGQWIYLLFDGQPRDAQGRLRAWVWRDGLFVNGALVRDGWAVGAVTDPRLAEYFATFETSARQEGRGLWRSPRSIAYYRQQPVTWATADADGPDAADTRVFSAPAPFPPPVSSSPGRTACAVGRRAVTGCPDRANDRSARATPLLSRGMGTRTVK